jgi:hypothetical protein
MEKYRNVKWIKEMEIEKERNTAKTQKEISRYDMNENKYKKSGNEDRSIRPGMSGFKLVVLIALGILLASFIGCVASLTFTGAVLKGVGDALENEQKNSTTIQLRPISITKPAENFLINPASKVATQAIEQMGQDMIKNIPKSRGEIVRLKSEEAVKQARAETQSFDSIYKKPAECYDTTNSATRIKCANDYIRARAAFAASNR